MKKVVVITGASSGIGLATAKRCLNEGCTVYGISLKLNEDHGFTEYQADVNDTARMQELFKEIFDKEGQLDVLVNNAGFGIAGAIEDSKPENIKAQISTNLTSMIVNASLALPYIKKSKCGRIVNTSSVGGLIPLPFQATYSASKAGVEIFSRALAIEVKPFGVKVTAICPGDTQTGFTAARVVDENKNSDYSKRMKRSVGKMEHDEQHGKSPDTVAKAICKAIKSKRPPLRKTVGGMSKFEVFLTRIVPLRFLSFVVRKIYG